MRIFPILDNDDGHAIRSTRVENPMHANVAALFSIEPRLLLNDVITYIVGVGNFALFAAATLTLTR